MRYDVKKYLFMGVEEERDLFFKRAQDAGIVHFVDAANQRPKETSQEVHTIAKSIKIVLGLPVEPQVDPAGDETGLDLGKEIVSIKSRMDSLAEEERKLRLEMSRVAVFGPFSSKDIALIKKEGNRVIQFFCAKQGYSDNPDLPEEVIYVGTDNGLDYFAAINKEPKQYPRMIEMIIEQPWNELDARHKEVVKEIDALEHRLKGYSKYNHFLHKSLVERLNGDRLEEAKGFVLRPIANEGIFAVEGWVPEHKKGELDKLVEEMNIFVEQIEIEPTDVVPTYLENKGAARIGEDLVHIYDTPSTTDKDPSLWVLVFFALFFSMIIGDGGYGLVLLLIALYIRYKHSNLHSLKKRVLDLATILAFCCIVWGVLTTSFFGINISPDNPIRKVSVLSWAVEKKAQYHLEHKDAVYQNWVKKFPDVANAVDGKDFILKASSDKGSGVRNYEAYGKFADNIMMELALLIGVIHVILSMGRHISRNWSYIGWILLIIGGYLYAPLFLDATTMPDFILGLDRDIAAKNGLYLVYAGMIIAVLIAIFKQKLLGILEATVVIQIFGDILSYMRLYALGLSGSLLTATTIDLAASAPTVFGIIILLLGHTMNLALGVMGGVIHGLRLNFLEWYHYSFEGGGKLFRPLKKEHLE